MAPLSLTSYIRDTVHMLSLVPRRWRNPLKDRAMALVPWLSVVLLAMLIIAPIALFVWLIFGTKTFIVQAVTVMDARSTTEASVRSLIKEELATVPLDQNIFFVQPSVIEAKIIRTMPQINTIRVTRKLPGTIVAIVQEKTAAVLLSSSGHYYFVDSAGIPYEEARLDTLPGVVLPTVKNLDKDSEVVLGAPALDPDFVSFVQALQKELPKQISAQVAEIHIPSLAAREVYFLLNNNWEIRFDVTRSNNKQLSALRRVLEDVITPEEKTKIQYIDLRIPDRIYYKTTDPVPVSH